MSNVYLLQNADNLFLDRQGQWVPGQDANSLFRTPHKDEAINQMVELSVRQPDWRMKIVASRLDDRGRPQVELSEAPATDCADEPHLTDEQLSEADNQADSSTASAVEYTDPPEAVPHH